MELIDEEQDLAVRLRDLVKHALEAFLELTAVLRTGNQGAHVEREERLILQRLRHIARHDAARKAFDDGRLADTRLTDEHWVVLRAAGKDLNRAADLLVTADDRIEFAGARRRREVAAELLEGLIAFLRVVRRDILLAVLADGRLDRGLRQVELTADVLYFTAAIRRESQQQVLRRHIVILHGLGVFLSAAEYADHVHAHAEAVRALDARDLRELLLESCLEHRHIRLALLKDCGQQPLRLFGQSQQDVC